MSAVFLGLLLLSSPAWAVGGSEGHGADTEWSDAWYLGSTKPIKYCLEASPGFLALHTDKEYHKIFEDAFDVWTKYLVDKKVEAKVVPFWVRFRTQLEPHVCKDEGIELKVDLGICGHRNLPRHGSRSLAAKAIAPSEKEPGILWLADPNRVTYSLHGTARPLDWSPAGLIESTLLHEIGHVFGTTHVRGTIMDEHIISQLMSRVVFNEPIPPMAIDGNKELFLCPNCEAETFDGELGWYSEAGVKEWKRFTGEDPPEKKAVLTLRHKGGATLTLNGVTMRLELNRGSANLFKGEEIFRAEFFAGFPLSRPHTATVVPGFLIARGHPIRVNLERNMASSNSSRSSYPVALYEMFDSPSQPKKLLFHSGEPTYFRSEPVDIPLSN